MSQGSKLSAILVMSCIAATVCLAQTPVEPAAPASPTTASDSRATPVTPLSGVGTDAGAGESTGLPAGFRGIQLGMSMLEVQTLIAADSLYEYRGEPDVSLLPRPDERLIEVSGRSYVRRAFFQFHEDRLFVIILSLNEREIDHYSVFSTLSAKYGNPASLSPSESVWDDGVVRLSLERPLALKYIDRSTFDSFREKGKAEKSWEEVLRSEFLGDL